MGACKWWIVGALMGLCLGAAACPQARSATTELISVGLTGDPNHPSRYLLPTISADGRFVTFNSGSATIVPGDTNGKWDVFLRDRVRGTTELISVSTEGEQANAASDVSAISADGRFVAFASDASNLVLGGTNGQQQVFLRDRQAGTTELISVTSTGEQGSGWSGDRVAISGDGRFVVFDSLARLAPDDYGNLPSVYLRDRLVGATELLTRGYVAWTPSMSVDARFIAFGHTYQTSYVSLYDRAQASYELISVSTVGEYPNGSSHYPSVSDDGRFVAFWSGASDLVADDTNGIGDVFVRDRLLGITERVNVASSGEQADGYSWWHMISANGRFVAFSSWASNLVPDDTNGVPDVFVRDRLLGTTERVSVSVNGDQANSWSSESRLDGPAISADGRFVVFTSDASNLVPEDTNGVPDVFVRDRYSFQDVPADHWAYDGVVACAAASIVAGYPDGLYHPEIEVTRDQMAVYIARALVRPSGDAGIPDPEPPPTFSDVPPDFWAYKQIEYAVSQNVVEGYPDDTCQPSLVVDRGQMAVYIARAMVAPTGDAVIADPEPPYMFPDVPGDDNAWAWCHKHVEFLAARAVVHGYDDGLYHPENAVTRDQMAVYIARAFDLPL
jgi:Tol biopolymer transport system component